MIGGHLDGAESVFFGTSVHGVEIPGKVRTGKGRRHVLNENKNQYDDNRPLASYNSGTFILFYHSIPAMSVPLRSLTLFLPDEAATEALARQFAPLVSGAHGLPAGGRIHLQGELGAGKTAFARALLRECGITGRIKSPSYALLESYKVSDRKSVV